MNGILNNQNSDDELMLREIAKTKSDNDPSQPEDFLDEMLQIYDARPKLNAQGNRLKGGGFEDQRFYLNCDLTFCDIDNIHGVTKVFEKMQEIPLSPDNFASIQAYGPKVEESGYLQIISKILKASNLIVQSIVEKRQNVLIHCSDGWDRTSQLCSLS